MIISIELAAYVSALRPFLQSLPSPFVWLAESSALTRLILSDRPSDVFGCLVELASDANRLGNAAYAADNRSEAVSAYTEAINQTRHALKARLDDAQKQTAHSILSIFLANRATALLLEGEGMDAQRALLDAEAAETFFPGYCKAYHCQWRAHQVLGNADKSRSVAQRALKNLGLDTWGELREAWLQPDINDSRDSDARSGGYGAGSGRCFIF
ncbi:hypothetical protein BV25DRAFT_1796366 [Artomyces pyxidatus]|uniref:Uncharacterized protein n=1 Tax=Artomyces pyxidatus TaxID=48021 RepID=A0ACB8TE10_9AGAM|nr:hypothetical protein BV25DRAFT_1796366 [Artomyces pyxidatus]